MKELICIVCPKGCRLTADRAGEGWTVAGHSCPRGEEYARAELTHPTRVVTSTVVCVGGAHPRCPVKTDRPIPKEKIFEVMAALDGVEVHAPAPLGTVVVEDVCHTGARVVTTRRV